ncbi:MAG: WD40 repeat domain-containing protein, partial [Candidatus Limnocylindria bacterium]
WSFPGEATADGDAIIGPPYFTPDGAFVVAGVFYDPAPDRPDLPPDGLVGLRVWDAQTGDPSRTLDIGPCGGRLMAFSQTMAVVQTLAEGTPCRGFEGSQLELLDLDSGERTILTTAGGNAAISGDGRYAAWDDYSRPDFAAYVVDTATGEHVMELTQDDVVGGQQDVRTRALNADGSLLLYGDRPMVVWDVARHDVAATFGGHAGETGWAVFADDDSIYSAGRDATLRHWSARGGQEFSRFSGVGSNRVALSASGFALVGRQDQTAVVVDLRPRGEVSAVETCHGFAPAGQLAVVYPRAEMSVYECDGATARSYVVDLESREVLAAVQGGFGQDEALSPDGTRFVRQEGDETFARGPAIHDAATGEVVVELEGVCAFDVTLTGDAAFEQPDCHEFPERPFPFYAQELHWSPDGTKVLAVNTGWMGGGVTVWDATTGRLEIAAPPPVFSAMFTPSGDQVIAATDGEDGRRHLLTYSIDSMTQVDDRAVDDEYQHGFFIGYSPDGSTIYVLDQPSFLEGGALKAIDAETLTVVRSRERVAEGSVKSWTLSDDGSLIATGSSDGFVRVWDAATFALVHEIFVGDMQVQGVAFATATHVAIVAGAGDILVDTINNDELLSIARRSLTRGFTDIECERFNFGESCPTLAELRGDD